MLTFLSRSFVRLFSTAPRSGATPGVRALPPAPDFPRESRRAPPRTTRAHLRVVGAEAVPDTAVAVAPVHVGASAFVAGQGARIYSLDAFRKTSGPSRPHAA